jgi:hypothetical protein
MGNIYPNIKPNGITQKDEVDLIYMILNSIQGACQTLDADDGVTLTTYEANCVTALFNLVVEDSKGNYINLEATETSSLEATHIINPTGISAAARIAFLYQLYNCMETLTEQLDSAGEVLLDDSNYESTCYTGKMLHRVENPKGGTILGVATGFTFRPGGHFHEGEYVDALYEFLDGWTTLLQKIDTDTGDTTLNATYFTATILLKVENTKGSTLGVSR